MGHKCCSTTARKQRSKHQPKCVNVNKKKWLTSVHGSHPRVDGDVLRLDSVAELSGGSAEVRRHHAGVGGRAAPVRADHRGGGAFLGRQPSASPSSSSSSRLTVHGILWILPVVVRVLEGLHSVCGGARVRGGRVARLAHDPAERADVQPVIGREARVARVLRVRRVEGPATDALRAAASAVKTTVILPFVVEKRLLRSPIRQICRW